MTSKELKRLSRRDLLELLVQEQQENEALTAKVTSLEKQLLDRIVNIENAGSMAEAALVLNGIFADADKAVEQYKENIRRCSEEWQKDYDKTIHDAQRRAAEIIRSAENEKRKIMKDADARLQHLNQLLDDYCKNHAELREVLSNAESE